MEVDIKKALEAIAELKKQVPEDWAIVIGAKMNKAPNTVRAYSLGERGVRNGAYLEVLKHLTVMVAERNEIIKQLTA